MLSTINSKKETSEQAFDLIFMTREQEVLAHEAIARAKSPVLDQLLRTAPKSPDGTKKLVYIDPKFSPAAVRCFVDYLYVNTYSLNAAEVISSNGAGKGQDAEQNGTDMSCSHYITQRRRVTNAPSAEDALSQHLHVLGLATTYEVRALFAVARDNIIETLARLISLGPDMDLTQGLGPARPSDGEAQDRLRAFLDSEASKSLGARLLTEILVLCERLARAKQALAEAQRLPRRS